MYLSGIEQFFGTLRIYMDWWRALHEGSVLNVARNHLQTTMVRAIYR